MQVDSLLELHVGCWQLNLGNHLDLKSTDRPDCYDLCDEPAHAVPMAVEQEIQVSEMPPQGTV